MWVLRRRERKATMKSAGWTGKHYCRQRRSLKLCEGGEAPRALTAMYMTQAKIKTMQPPIKITVAPETVTGPMIFSFPLWSATSSWLSNCCRLRMSLTPTMGANASVSLQKPCQLLRIVNFQLVKTNNPAPRIRSCKIFRQFWGDFRLSREIL